MNRISIFILFFSLNIFGCNGQVNPETHQNKDLSQDFDKSPPFFYKMPSKLSSEDRSPGWNSNGEKILLTGIVYELDGKTPATNIILYYYQTDADGVYSVNHNEPRNMPMNKLGQTHGHIRGWVKTNAQGEYSIYTIQPGTYPTRDEPAHIHLNVKEPDLDEPYYIDDFIFDNDPMLNTKRRNDLENRGGSGVIRFVEKDGMKVGERNIILGLNITNYPKANNLKAESGKKVGEDVISFRPYHAYGPDKGSKTCPICKYGWYHGILYFVGNDPDWLEIKKWLLFLDNESSNRNKYLKSYFIYGNNENFNKEARFKQLEKLGDELELKNIALTFVPSFTDIGSDIYLNEISQDASNTFIIYRRSNIIAKYQEFRPTQENFESIRTLLDNENVYFKISKPKN